MNKIATTDGIALAAKMLHNGYMAEVAGKVRQTISSGINHSLTNGKLYWFTEDDRQKFQYAIRKIGTELLMAQLVPEPTTPEDDPYCGGEDWVQKFRTLRTRINLPYLFTSIGKNKAWYSNRLTGKTKVYNKFTPEEISTINAAIHQIALELCSIELVADSPHTSM